MATAKESCCWPLGKVTDGAHWDASDLFGRLCIVADAAFLSAGFQPCNDDAPAPETTPWSVSRRYTLPQPPADRDREGANADAAVLCISRRGRRRGGCGRGRFEVSAYVDCGDGRQRNARGERLPLAALAPVLSGGVGDAARALTTNGGASWLWKLLADQLSRRLFVSVCLHGDVPVLPSFACLPVDLQLAILRRLSVAAEDVARAECASRELRRLVADHDAVLWKARYERIRPRKNKNIGFGSESEEQPVGSGPPFFTDEDMPLTMSWKERYAVARWQRKVKETWETLGRTPMPAWRPRVPAANRARLHTIVDTVRRRARRYSWQHHNTGPADQPRTVARTTSTDHGWRGISANDRSTRMTMVTEVQRSKPYRKGSGAGAVHSPSSRHRWNHR